MLTFSKFLSKRDPILFEQLLSEGIVLDEGIWQSTKNIARQAMLGGALAAGTLFGPTAQHDTQTKPVAVNIANNQEVKSIIDYVKFKYDIDLKSKDFHFYKPSDIVGSEYGKDWNKVKSMASKAISTPEKIGDVEVPRLMSASDINVAKMDTPIPVIFMDPTRFSGVGAGTDGFCTSTSNGEKFCVVKSPDLIHILRHELSHAVQNTAVQTSLSDDSEALKYLTNDAEIGVRLGELKRNYYQKYGKIITKEVENPDEQVSFSTAFKDLMTNPKNYSDDVQQLGQLYSHYKKTNNMKKLSELLHFMNDHIDTVVMHGQSNWQGLPNLQYRA